MAAPGKGLIFGGMATGGGLVLTALGFAPATTEALPFGLVLTVFGLLFAVPGYRSLRRRLKVERTEHAAVGAALVHGPPSSVECPSCRGPAPLCLFKPDRSTCAYCGHQFALPAELAQQLTAGAAAVKAQSEAERHITRSVEQLALKEATWVKKLSNLARWLWAVAVLVFLWAFVTRNTNDQWHAWAFNAVSSGAFAAWMFLQARARVPAEVRNMVGRWAALKLPNVEGLGCRVCGGPLPAESKPVLRCGYCSADNLAGKGVLAQVAAGAAHAQASALSVNQRRAQGEELLAFALNAYLPATLVAWFAIGAFAGSGFLSVDDALRLWVDPTARFLLLRVEQGGVVRPCLAAFKEAPGGVELQFDAWRKVVVSSELVAAVQAREPVPPAWLEGQVIDGKAYYGGGRAIGVRRYLRWPDRHMLRFEGDDYDHYLPSNYGGGGLTCLAEEVKGQAMQLPPKREL